MRSVEYFLDKEKSAESTWDYECLIEEARDALAAWRQSPPPVGGHTPEPEYGSSQWKRWVALNGTPVEEIARTSRSLVSEDEIIRVSRDYSMWLDCRERALPKVMKAWRELKRRGVTAEPELFRRSEAALWRAVADRDSRRASSIVRAGGAPSTAGPRRVMSLPSVAAVC